MTATETARGTMQKEVAALEHVSLYAGQAYLLRGVSLRLAHDELVCVLGPNGAGKSTLLSLLNATARPTEGRVTLLGEKAWQQKEGRRASLRARIGTVLQRSDYNPRIPATVTDVVAMGRTGLRGPLHPLTAEDDSEVRTMIGRMQLGRLAAREYRSLSGGEQQKTQIARALAQRPELLLLDEPAAGLDIDWQERLTTLVGSLFSDSGIPIVMTTHHTHHVPPECTRVVLLSRGSVVMDASPGEALSAPVLSGLYGCRVEVIERRGRRYCHAAGEPAC